MYWSQSLNAVQRNAVVIMLGLLRIAMLSFSEDILTIPTYFTAAESVKETTLSDVSRTKPKQEVTATTDTPTLFGRHCSHTISFSLRPC